MRSHTFVSLIIASFAVLLTLYCGDESAARPTDPGSEKAERGTAEVAPDATEIHIQSIRNVYADAMKSKLQSRESECDEDPLNVVIQIRTTDPSGNKILWIRRTSGYDHGAASYEALIHNKKVVFVMKEMRTWNFDPENPPEDNGISHTVDRAEQHRYYFLDGSLVRSLYKEATSHSIKKESLDAKLQDAPNKKHPAPNAGEALEMARALLERFETGGLKADWCSL
ncbi:MAG: hypothetical protein KDK23_01875 [Leptospiraceae bacterium]|nr:hypothetical protein [Leptospiraceae bacterium]